MQQLIGVGVIVKREQKVLLGKRLGSHGAGSWGLPGGHLDAGEIIEHCAGRELTEETGLIANSFDRVGFSESIFDTLQRHYITLFVEAIDAQGQPCLCEPAKCEEWRWFDTGQLPQPLFAPLLAYLDQGNKL